MVEEEWITTLSTINYDDIQYEPFIEAGQKLARELKQNDVIKNLVKLLYQTNKIDFKFYKTDYSTLLLFFSNVFY